MSTDVPCKHAQRDRHGIPTGRGNGTHPLELCRGEGRVVVHEVRCCLDLGRLRQGQPLHRLGSTPSCSKHRTRPHRVGGRRAWATWASSSRRSCWYFSSTGAGGNGRLRCRHTVSTASYAGPDAHHHTYPSNAARRPSCRRSRSASVARLRPHGWSDASVSPAVPIRTGALRTAQHRPQAAGMATAAPLSPARGASMAHEHRERERGREGGRHRDRHAPRRCRRQEQGQGPRRPL
jgi:hypothetical protein